MPLITTNVDPVAKIKVIGVGGAGCNAINTMMTDYDIPGVSLWLLIQMLKLLSFLRLQ